MPWSWVRVSRATSLKLRKCTGDDTSAPRFEACARRIAEAAGAEAVDVKFSPDGTFALVYFYWDDPQVKYAVVFDLQGEDALDLLGVEDMQRLAARDPGA